MNLRPVGRHRTRHVPRQETRRGCAQLVRAGGSPEELREYVLSSHGRRTISSDAGNEFGASTQDSCLMRGWTRHYL
jgi:hypothetical protein